MDTQKIIYCDNAATTPISREVLDAMLPYLTEHYGNASSIYSLGRDAKRAVEAAREKVAAGIGADVAEVYFTGCGTESDNWAIKSTVERLAAKGKNHLITTEIEHHAVLHVAQYLNKKGIEVTYLPVSPDGYVTAEQVQAAITDKTALVSVMYANNEIGTVQPIREIGRICRNNGVLFHTDAVQAMGNIPIDVKEDFVDMLTLSGHKINAPKGVGALYVRKGIPIFNMLHGGAQERNRRGGTENVSSVVAMGKAVEIAADMGRMKERLDTVTALRDRLKEGLLQLPRVRLNGGMDNRLAGNLNVSIEGIEGESLLLSLDMAGICASSGSACTSGSLDPSHVLLALGLPHEIAHGSLRFSLSDQNTVQDVDTIIQEMNKIVPRLRAMSPLWERIEKEGV